ncbi:MAG TPA: multidrug efflux SMR transporter [Phycisphaerae bacterium]|jgi:quaternary ammonium compound-resistance protein SugE
MPWLLLIIAGICEMVWPLGFKYTHAFSQNYWAIGCTFAVMGLSLYLMSLATKLGIPIGTAYAVWTGIGAAGTAALGILLFQEPRDLVRLACLGLIIAGIVGLKILSPVEKPAAPTPIAETSNG